MRIVARYAALHFAASNGHLDLVKRQLTQENIMKTPAVLCTRKADATSEDSDVANVFVERKYENMSK